MVFAAITSLRIGRRKLLAALVATSLLFVAWHNGLGSLPVDYNLSQSGQDNQQFSQPQQESGDHTTSGNQKDQSQGSGTAGYDDDLAESRFLKAAFDRGQGYSPEDWSNNQHGHFFQAMEDSDYKIEIPVWDPSRPLPTWYLETQAFIKRLESEDRPYPFFEKFMAFDVHIWLGLNNIRYILEMSNMFGILLGRTLVIPSFVYARSCHQYELCRLSGRLVNLAEITDPYFGRWELDINTFWDVEGMRKTLNVLTSIEFNRVMMVKHGVIVEDPEEWVASQGGDLRMPRSFGLLKVYHDLNQSISVDSQPLLSELYNRDKGITIVDDVAPILTDGQLPNNGHPWSRHEQATVWKIRDSIEMSINHTSKEVIPLRWEEERLSENVTGSNGQIPLGFKQIFDTDATILHLQAGVHQCGNIPFVFTTAASVERYENVVLRELPVSETIKSAREYLLSKLHELLIQEGERTATTAAEDGDNASAEKKPPSYIGVHIRRGDFVTVQWTENASSQLVANWIVHSILSIRDQGIDLTSLGSCKANRTKPSDGNTSPYPPFSTKEKAGKGGIIPWENIASCINQRFYFSTDETSPEFIDTLRHIGGIFIEDLVDDTFIENYLRLLPYGDYIGLLDQWLLAHADVFVGSQYSSFTGGVYNLRKGLGRPLSTNQMLNKSYYGMYVKWSE